MMKKISKEELAARWKRFRKYGAKYRHALEARDWLYRVEVSDLSDYAGYDLT